MQPIETIKDITHREIIIFTKGRKTRYYKATFRRRDEWLLEEHDKNGKRLHEPRKPKKGESRTRWLMPGNLSSFAKPTSTGQITINF